MSSASSFLGSPHSALSRPPVLPPHFLLLCPLHHVTSLFLLDAPRIRHLAVPGAPPQQVRGVALDSRSLRISWEPPPRELHNGAITYYKVKYIRADAAPGAAPYEALKGPAELSHTVTGLDKWTPYRIWVLAGTSVGDGPGSSPVLVRTDEDGTSSGGDAPFPSFLLASHLPPPSSVSFCTVLFFFSNYN